MVHHQEIIHPNHNNSNGSRIDLNYMKKCVSKKRRIDNTRIINQSIIHICIFKKYQEKQKENQVISKNRSILTRKCEGIIYVCVKRFEMESREEIRISLVEKD